MRSELTDYAVTQGLSAAAVKSIVMPGAWKCIRKAMMFDKGAKAVAEKVKPVATSAPKNVAKPGAASNQSTQQGKREAALAKLAQSGTIDDAEAAFAARFG